jgi:dipeptidyl aminopeptidase/acylaminoacyl peptidase
MTSIHTFAVLVVAFGLLLAMPLDAQRSSIAFRGFDGNDQIWIVDSNGSEPVSLIGHFGPNVHTADPDWSPDGEWIAFVLATISNAKDLWIMRSDGTEARELVRQGRTNNDYSTLKEPAWSPNGSRIVFTDISSRMYFVDIDNPVATFVASPEFQGHPDWTPDGQQIVFSGSGSLIFVSSVGGGDAQRIGDQDHGYGAPEVSPDGKRIVFWTSHVGISVMDIDGSNERFLVDAKDASWSPDAKQIAVTLNGTDISIINADGTGLHTILESATIRNIGELAWSPLLGDDTAVPSNSWGVLKQPGLQLRNTAIP